MTSIITSTTRSNRWTIFGCLKSAKHYSKFTFTPESQIFFKMQYF